MTCGRTFADPHKQRWTAEEARLEREREKAARIKAEAAKAAAVAQAVVDQEAAIARLTAARAQEPADQGTSTAQLDGPSLPQVDGGSLQVPASLSRRQADAALLDDQPEQPSKRRCVT